VKEKSSQELLRQNLRCKHELHWAPPNKLWFFVTKRLQAAVCFKSNRSRVNKQPHNILAVLHNIVVARTKWECIFFAKFNALNWCLIFFYFGNNSVLTQ
jgi:hypothetical protein